MRMDVGSNIEQEVVRAEVADRLFEIDRRVAPAAEDQRVDFFGFQLFVKGGVFNPSVGRSAKMMVEAIKKCPPQMNDNVLEMGIGAGGLSLLMSKIYGIKNLTGLDINPDAIESAEQNFKTYRVQPRLLKESDLFGAVSRQVTAGIMPEFDYIVFNAPTFHPSAPTDGPGAVALWDPSGSVKQDFLKQAREVITVRARILIMYSRYADYDSLEKVDFSDFHVETLERSTDKISEAGVLLLTKEGMSPK